MSKNLEIKKQVVSDIVKKFQDAQSVIVVSFSGLSVEDVTALRAQFRQNNVEYCVLKNTLVRRALHELNIEGLDDVLNGPSAFAFGMSDPVSPAKIVSDFIDKKKTDAIQIKAGLMGTEILSDAQIKELATGPPAWQPAEQHRWFRSRSGCYRQEEQRRHRCRPRSLSAERAA